MASDRLQSRADALVTRVEALAMALRASGVSEETSTRLLSQASAAVLQALTVELLLDQPETPIVERGTPLEPCFRLAA
jgi:hypothetical protein